MLKIRAPATSLDGRARVGIDLAYMEKARHRRVILLLEEVLDTVRLTPEQAREVVSELAARRLLVQDADGALQAAWNVICCRTYAARTRERRRA